MDAKTILKNIKALFSELPAEPAPAPTPAPEPVQVEMKEYALADGTIVKLDKLEIGGMVTINDLPAPVGEHLLADGTKIKLDEAGVIVEVEAAEPAEPVLPVEAAAPVQMRDERVDALQTELKQVKQGFSQLVALVESLTETPAAEPIEPQKTQFGEIAQTKKERLSKITQVLTQIKNK